LKRGRERRTTLLVLYRMTSGGGIFLAALKEKNSTHRASKVNLTEGTLVRTASHDSSAAGGESLSFSTTKKSSIFGSFFGSKKRESMPSNLEAPEEEKHEESTFLEGETNNEQITVAKSDEGAKPQVMNIVASGSSKHVEEKDAVEARKPDVEPIIVEARERPLGSAASPVAVIEPSTPLHHGAQSAGQLEGEPSAHIQVTRQRRASTTVENRRLSIHTVEQTVELYGRERAPSNTTVETMYARTGRTAPNFEMVNPMHADQRPMRRELSVTASQADLDVEKAKRASLYHAVSHVDQAILLERRNTRAGRSSSIMSAEDRYSRDTASVDQRD